MEIVKVPIFYPYVNDAMRREVQKTLNTRWIGQGPKVVEFEKRFGKIFGVDYPVAVNSGTAALWLAFHLIGLKKGDEVITSVLNCSADAIALTHFGVKIVFADIDELTMNINWTDVKKKITPKTKAIINVHLSGNLSICPFKTKIPIIGDYSQAHVKPLSCDDFACYSLQAIKHITTGDGGMLVVRSEKLYKRAKRLRWFGIDRDKKWAANFKNYLGREMTTDILEAGYKFQMTDIAASLGIGALKSYRKIINHHCKLKSIYDKLLRNVPGLTRIGGIWSYPVLVEDRDAFAQKLEDNGIETNTVQVRNDMMTVFGGKRLNLPNMNRLESKYIHLPLHMRVDRSDVHMICKVIREGRNG